MVLYICEKEKNISLEEFLIQYEKGENDNG